MTLINSKSPGNQGSKSFRIAVRINGSVTSISMRKNITALWLVLSDIGKVKQKDFILDFVYSSLDLWNGDTAKGFSDFVSEKMIAQILEKDDYHEYKKILTYI